MRLLLLLVCSFLGAAYVAASEKAALVINSTEERNSPEGKQFVPLIHAVPGWAGAAVRVIWVGDFTSELLRAEPKPSALFLSGSFKDWCEVNRQHWVGVEKVLKKRSIPIWASCGGAQALAILSEVGTSKEWDCPHCRNNASPKSPIYTHLGHLQPGKACGDYSGCIFEKGPTNVRLLRRDVVFSGLPDEFQVMESHCGQIAWPPRGWDLIATAGNGSVTHVQCLKRRDAPIYAAQFHIEMEGTPATSLQVMRNFLAEAEKWNRSH